VSLADRLARHYAALRFEALPRTVVDKAIELIGYDIALALRGYSNEEESGQAVALARSLSPSGGPCVVIGAPVRA
jgi:hypothetical protein